VKVVVDVNLAPAWADRLTTAGHEANHWSQIGPLDAKDSEILAWAVEHNAVLLTCDLDFGAILASSQARTPSVLQIRARDVMPAAMDERVEGLLEDLRAELEQGAIVSVDFDLARIRVLPLVGRETTEA
jgi:predicted nuclease of predicted toxin-antitoxin system